MPTVTLLEKAYGVFSQENIEQKLSSLCKGLKVKVKFQDKTELNWVKVEITGEDQTAALQLLDREIGSAPVSPDNIRKFSVLCGRIIDSGKSATELRVDVGVFEPKVMYANIPLQRLQAQLADGERLPLKSLIELYCLHDNMPLQVKVLDAELSSEKEAFEVELSEHQLGLFTSWLRAFIDRLMVLGAQLQDVEHAINASKHFRDVTKIESLGLLEHAILCKLGTDAVGLIPAMGPYLSTVTFASFSPRKILRIVNRSTFGTNEYI